MSGKLDQSLDEILSTRRTGTAARGRPRRRGATTRAAPVGGVSKSAAKATTKTTGKGNATAAAGGIDSKIIVSNLVGRPLSKNTNDLTLTMYSLPMSRKTRSRYVEQPASSLGILALSHLFNPLSIKATISTMFRGTKELRLSGDSTCEANGSTCNRRPCF